MQDYTASQLLKRLLREHLSRYKRYLAIAIVCMILVAMANAANAWLIQPVLDQIFIEKNRTALMVIPAAVFCVSLIGALANYGNLMYMRIVGQRVIADMQVRLFSHLMKSDIGLFHQESSGRLISRFTSDINLLRAAFSTVLTSVAKDSISLVFLLGVMAYQNLELTLVALPVFFFAIYPIIRLGKRMRKISHKAQVQLGEFASSLDEVFKGVRTVKSYNRESFEVTRAKAMIEELFRLYKKAIRVQTAASPMMELLGGISMAAVIWYGGYQVLDGSTSPGAFFSFITAFLMAYRPVRSMSGLNTTFQEGVSAAARLFAVIDTPPSIVDRPEATPLAVSTGGIRYDNVSFHYRENGQGVHHISLEVPAGKTAALVGMSGGGKSTLMNLLLRFYDVDAGSITIDGQDIHQVTLESLRAAMAFVPQESMLFEDTIRANIAYGRLDATEQDIQNAAKNAAAEEFIMALPQGYDTMVGAQGVRLSGGQRQRIAIARAMLKNAPILLLDEATSSLDNESERSIQQALDTLMKGRTTLVIAHRLTTIVGADIIYVIENGRVSENGNHLQLMSKKGRYYQLYAQDFAAEHAG